MMEDDAMAGERSLSVHVPHEALVEAIRRVVARAATSGLCESEDEAADLKDYTSRILPRLVEYAIECLKEDAAAENERFMDEIRVEKDGQITREVRLVETEDGLRQLEITTQMLPVQVH